MFMVEQVTLPKKSTIKQGKNHLVTHLAMQIKPLLVLVRYCTVGCGLPSEAPRSQWQDLQCVCSRFGV
jgi:hypothetical protein